MSGVLGIWSVSRRSWLLLVPPLLTATLVSHPAQAMRPVVEMFCLPSAGYVSLQTRYVSLVAAFKALDSSSKEGGRAVFEPLDDFARRPLSCSLPFGKITFSAYGWHPPQLYGAGGGFDTTAVEVSLDRRVVHRFAAFGDLEPAERDTPFGSPPLNVSDNGHDVTIDLGYMSDCHGYVRPRPDGAGNMIVGSCDPHYENLHVMR